jgi:hypothetical protein
MRSQGEAVWKIIDCRGETVDDVDPGRGAVEGRVNEEDAIDHRRREDADVRTYKSRRWQAGEGVEVETSWEDKRNEGAQAYSETYTNKILLSVGTRMTTSIALCVLPRLTLFHSDQARTQFCP